MVPENHFPARHCPRDLHTRPGWVLHDAMASNEAITQGGQLAEEACAFCPRLPCALATPEVLALEM